MAKKWTDRLPDLFGRRRIWQLECELEEAQGEIEELQAEAGVVSANFEKDCWRSMRRLLDLCKFDWSGVGSDGVTADEAEEFIRETINDLEAQIRRATPSPRVTDAHVKAAAEAYWGVGVQHGEAALDQMRLALEAAAVVKP